MLISVIHPEFQVYHLLTLKNVILAYVSGVLSSMKQKRHLKCAWWKKNMMFIVT